MAEFYRQFAFVSSVLAGFSFTFYGTLLIAVRQHCAGTWAAFLAVTASVAFLPVTLGMTFTAARATNQPSDFSILNAAADPQLVLLSMLFLSGLVLLFASFGVSGWIRSRGLGIAATSLSLMLSTRFSRPRSESVAGQGYLGETGAIPQKFSGAKRKCIRATVSAFCGSFS